MTPEQIFMSMLGAPGFGGASNNPSMMGQRGVPGGSMGGQVGAGAWAPFAPDGGSADLGWGSMGGMPNGGARPGTLPQPIGGGSVGGMLGGNAGQGMPNANGSIGGLQQLMQAIAAQRGMLGGTPGGRAYAGGTPNFNEMTGSSRGAMPLSAVARPMSKRGY